MSWKSVAVCEDCWDKRNPDRPAFRLREGPEETCCYCGDRTTSGIYTRENVDDQGRATD
jgi:hypothetical protein